MKVKINTVHKKITIIYKGGKIIDYYYQCELRNPHANKPCPCCNIVSTNICVENTNKNKQVRATLKYFIKSCMDFDIGIHGLVCEDCLIAMCNNLELFKAKFQLGLI